jgi:hypothetical protein
MASKSLPSRPAHDCRQCASLTYPHLMNVRRMARLSWRLVPSIRSMSGNSVNIRVTRHESPGLDGHGYSA